jgi:hypothetical protein
METQEGLEYTAKNAGVSADRRTDPGPAPAPELNAPTPISSIPYAAGSALASTKGQNGLTYLNVRSDAGSSFDVLRGFFNQAPQSTEKNLVLPDSGGQIAKTWFANARDLSGSGVIYQLSSTEDTTATGSVLRYELALPISNLSPGAILTDRKNTPLASFKSDQIAKVSDEKVSSDSLNKVFILESMTAGSANEALIRKGDWEKAISTMKPTVGRTIVTAESTEGIRVLCWVGFPRVEKLAKGKRAAEFKKISANPEDGLKESSSICTVSGLVN